MYGERTHTYPQKVTHLDTRTCRKESITFYTDVYLQGHNYRARDIKHYKVSHTSTIAKQTPQHLTIPNEYGKIATKQQITKKDTKTQLRAPVRTVHISTQKNRDLSKFVQGVNL